MGVLGRWISFVGCTGVVTGTLVGLGGWMLGKANHLPVLVSLGLNWGVGLLSVLAASERVFDLTGSVTFIAASAVNLRQAAAAVGGDVLQLHTRQLAATGGLAVWALRLGTFLFARICSHGQDCRFDGIRERPLAFINFWSLQALWVFLTSLPVYVVNAIPQQPAALQPQDIVGAALWLLGLTIEWVADAQKSRFRTNPKNKNSFISSGLWAWSRHPNYCGEIMLWTGMCVLCSPAFTAPAHWAACISPMFVAFLLTNMSGVPLLEAKADERWGNDPAYVRYKASTSAVLLWPPRKTHAD